jgi:hypothetical protein
MVRPHVKFTVSSIISILAFVAILSGSVLLISRLWEAGRQEDCRRNMMDIALCLCQYLEMHGAFPAGTIANAQLPPERRLSWVVSGFDFYDQLTWLLDRSESWESEANRVVRTRDVLGEVNAVGRVGVLVCPAASDGSDEHMPGWTWYIGVAGVGTDAPTLPLGHPRSGIFGYDRQTSIPDIKDGRANTLLLLETGVDQGPWTAGGPATVRGLDPARQPYIGQGRQFGGLHRQGVMVAMADGTVRFLSETINPKVFEALSTVAGGETLPAMWDR